ncbi:unnamed protein product [Litomosoides sigmodontis]|uniref:Uncharacterized protein n=1 Tax=Litomosoides sigmodontis TaxID=42156 RepID=A0A3P6TPK3_LITSI|nr:unnamed protein product [Litomosoides sigmodontis]
MVTRTTSDRVSAVNVPWNRAFHHALPMHCLLPLSCATLCVDSGTTPGIALHAAVMVHINKAEIITIALPSNSNGNLSK